MSILIKGIEMPTNGYDCPLNSFGICNVASDGKRCVCGFEFPDWCPLIPLPEGHGRLIDADSLLQSLGDLSYKGSVRRVLLSAPTIVPAEGGTENA